MSFLEAFGYILTKNRHKTLFKAGFKHSKFPIDFENLKIGFFCQNYGQNQGSMVRS